MIEGIDIKYYQSHLDTSIDFHPGTTAITGLSMDGKTAILRAFEQLRTNRPLGTRRIYRYEKEPLEIVLRVDGHRVGMKKGEKPIDSEGNKSMYWIDYPNGSRQEFKTIGVGPPPPQVVELIGVSDIAIQKQLDAYLLVTSTAGEIAKTINRITGLDEGEVWVKQLTKGINEIGKEDKIISVQFELDKAELAKYDGVDDLRRDILEAKGQQLRYDQGIQQMAEIMDTINIIEGAAAQLAQAQRIREELGLLLSEWDGLQAQHLELQGDLNEIKRAERLQEDTEVAELKRDTLQPLLDQLYEIEDKLGWCREVIAIRDDYYEKKTVLEIAEEQLEETKDQYALELAKLGKCFVCASDISDPDKIRRNL